MSRSYWTTDMLTNWEAMAIPDWTLIDCVTITMSLMMEGFGSSETSLGVNNWCDYLLVYYWGFDWHWYFDQMFAIIDSMESYSR
jgi:hypothetical protein